MTDYRSFAAAVRAMQRGLAGGTVYQTRAPDGEQLTLGRYREAGGAHDWAVFGYKRGQHREEHFRKTADAAHRFLELAGALDGDWDDRPYRRRALVNALTE